MFGKRVSPRAVSIGVFALMSMSMVAGCGGGQGSSSLPTPAAALDTVTIPVNLDGSLYKPVLTRDLKRNPPSLVRWFNNTDTELKFAFSNNKKPFKGSEISEYVVPPHTHTGWYILSDGMNGQGRKEYAYQGIPPAPPLWGPPGNPVVGADD